jgi:hypothetical protein
MKTRQVSKPEYEHVLDAREGRVLRKLLGCMCDDDIDKLLEDSRYDCGLEPRELHAVLDDIYIELARFHDE